MKLFVSLVVLFLGMGVAQAESEQALCQAFVQTETVSSLTDSEVKSELEQLGLVVDQVSEGQKLVQSQESDQSVTLSGFKVQYKDQSEMISVGVGLMMSMDTALLAQYFGVSVKNGFSFGCVKVEKDGPGPIEQKFIDRFGPYPTRD